MNINRKAEVRYSHTTAAKCIDQHYSQYDEYLVRRVEFALQQVGEYELGFISANGKPSYFVDCLNVHAMIVCEDGAVVYYGDHLEVLRMSNNDQYRLPALYEEWLKSTAKNTWAEIKYVWSTIEEYQRYYRLEEVQIEHLYAHRLKLELALTKTADCAFVRVNEKSEFGNNTHLPLAKVNDIVVLKDGLALETSSGPCLYGFPDGTNEHYRYPALYEEWREKMESKEDRPEKKL